MTATPLDTWLSRTLGHTPRDPALFQRALTHSSHSAITYERLEFLGDRVLGLAAAAWLYELFPNEPEGALSRRINALVSRETCADVGRAINPAFVERQDEGATLQGIGTGLFEEVLFERGVLATDSLLEYRVPTTRDVPDEMTCVIVENADGPGPFGAKGCGEGGLAAVAGAVATALADAGVPMTTLPLTPERVWRRMRSLNSERED
jgi:hypothetical protein